MQILAADIVVAALAMSVSAQKFQIISVFVHLNGIKSCGVGSSEETF